MATFGSGAFEVFHAVHPACAEQGQNTFGQGVFGIIGVDDGSSGRAQVNLDSWAFGVVTLSTVRACQWEPRQLPIDVLSNPPQRSGTCLNFSSRSKKSIRQESYVRERLFNQFNVTLSASPLHYDNCDPTPDRNFFRDSIAWLPEDHLLHVDVLRRYVYDAGDTWK